MKQEILTQSCPVCGKKIVSMYKRQLDYNFKAHLAKHEIGEEENEKENNSTIQ